MDATLASHLGRNVRAAQKATESSLSGLAELTGLARSTVTRAARLTRARNVWEPRFSTVQKIADALQTDVTALTQAQLRFETETSTPAGV